MAKYTTLLRSLVEMNYPLNMTMYPIFDENYRSILNQKIIAHYLFREIGFETAALFRDRLNTRLNEIMPYYNQLYNSELLKFDPLINNKYTENFSGHDNSDKIENQIDGRKINVDSYADSQLDSIGGKEVNETGKLNTTSSSNGKTKTLASDTPQGLLSSDLLENELYISNAALGESGEETNSEENKTANQVENTKTNTTGHNTNSQTTDDNFAGEKTGKEDFWKTWERKFEGMQGISGAELLNKFRETFLNIDMMVINELGDLFMCIW